MYFPRTMSLLIAAPMASATPWLRGGDMIIPRQNDASCGTATSTVTSTVTASGQGTALATVVSVTSTISSLITISGGSSQLTCFSSATTLTPAAPTPKNRKRDDQSYKVYEIIEDFDCECDGVGPHTTTTFSTSYFSAPASSTSASDGCSSGTTTTTITTTLTPAMSGASTTTVTTTVAATQTAAVGASALAPTPQGLNYYFYADQTYPTPQIDFVNVTELPQLLLQVENHSNFTHSGTVANINGLQIHSPNDADPKFLYGEVQTITMPDGYQAHGNMFGIVFQGYLYAASGAGTYSIQSVNPVMDDVGLVWLGPNALGNNWNQGNANYQIILSQPTQQTSVQLAAGEAMPLTIFYANVDGPGRASFNVVTPDGTVHDDTTGFFVGGCGNTGFIP